VSGKKIEKFVTSHKNASVTSEILRDLLKQSDMVNQSEAIPFLHLDRRRNHFQMPFIDCMTAQETKWTVCIGVPYMVHMFSKLLTPLGNMVHLK
jgi:hypothetical protein